MDKFSSPSGGGNLNSPQNLKRDLEVETPYGRYSPKQPSPQPAPPPPKPEVTSMPPASTGTGIKILVVILAIIVLVIGAGLVYVYLDLTGKIKSISCANADAVGFIYRENDQTMISFETQDLAAGCRAKHLAGKAMPLEWSQIFID